MLFRSITQLMTNIRISKFRQKVFQEMFNQSTQIESEKEGGNQDHRLAL